MNTRPMPRHAARYLDNLGTSREPLHIRLCGWLMRRQPLNRRGAWRVLAPLFIAAIFAFALLEELIAGLTPRRLKLIELRAMQIVVTFAVVVLAAAFVQMVLGSPTFREVIR